jgi:DNA repair protein RecO (recombination protein O)
MPPIASDALVLRTYPLGETSKVVVLLTRERGKLRAVAKGARGARPRYQSALEPLSEVRVSLHGRQGAELYRLGDCELVRSAFRAGSRGLDSALALSYFAELLDAFAQDGEAEDTVYRLALAVLAAAETGMEVKALARYIEAWLLKLHGIYPPLDRCAACDGCLPPGGLDYHAPAHGFVCAACGPGAGPRLSTGARGFLADLFRHAPGDVQAPLPDDAPVLEAFQRELIRRHLERDLKSYGVLREVAREPYR